MTDIHIESSSAPDGKIHIALTFDDNFWAPAYATMRSVCLHTKRRADVTFHLFERQLSEDHKSDLRQITTEFGASLVWYDLDKSAVFADIAKRMPYNARLTNIVYARLLIDQLIDPSITRILYLDCDMMVKAPIEALFNVDLEGNSIAAVQDPFSLHVVHGRDILKNRDIFDPADPYFNAGLVLIDVASWHAAHIPQRLESALADGTMARMYYDQDFLNLVFSGKWLQLANVWNFIEARREHESVGLKIAHYTGDKKPWHYSSNAAFARTYRHVMTNALFYKFMRHRWKRFWIKKVGMITRRK